MKIPGTPARASQGMGWIAMPDLPTAAIPPFGIILDIVVIIAVFGLWLAWWRNLNRLHKTEQLLAESIQQLELASSQLKQATNHIRALEKKGRARSEDQKRGSARQHSVPHQESAEELLLKRTLRLERQGKSDEEIADLLHIPVNQVRLMLKMHSTKEH